MCFDLTLTHQIDSRENHLGHLWYCNFVKRLQQTYMYRSKNKERKKTKNASLLNSQHRT